MNFVLHFHLAARALGSPAAAAGAMLPDLWRMADRRVRARPNVAPPGAADREGLLAAVLAGIEHHLAVDRTFHTSAEFVEGEALTTTALKSVGAPKVAVFAHVAWEIALDGALVRMLGADPANASVRRGLEDAFAGSPSAADRAASLHHFDAIARAEGDRAAFDARMRKIAAAIAEGPWIAGYADAEGLAVRLQGVRARLGLAPLGPREHETLVRALGSLAPRADQAVRAIVTAGA